MKTVGKNMNLENDTVTISGKKVTLNLTTPGHYSVPSYTIEQGKMVSKVLYTGKEAAINKYYTQHENLKTALNDKVLCKKTRGNNYCCFPKFL